MIVTLNTGNSGTVFSNKGVFVFVFVFFFLGTSEKTKPCPDFCLKISNPERQIREIPDPDKPIGYPPVTFVCLGQ